MLYEFLRNHLLDARNFFDPSRPPYHQNQFGATLGGSIIRDKLFFFGDYEGLRMRQAQPSTSLVPTHAQGYGDFSSSQFDLSSPTGMPDCNGNPTYAGELFDTRATQATTRQPTGFCGVPFGYANGAPSNVIPVRQYDPLGQQLINLFPLPTPLASAITTFRIRSFPKRRIREMSAWIRFFPRRTMRFIASALLNPTLIPSPLPGLADGGGFFDGIQDLTATTPRLAKHTSSDPRG